MMSLKEKDLIIISLLRINSRDSLVMMSKTSGIPVSTIYDRLSYIKKKGLVQRFVSLLSDDFYLLNSFVRAILIIPSDYVFSSHVFYLNSLFKTHNTMVYDVVFKNSNSYRAFKQHHKDIYCEKIIENEKKEGFIF